MLLIIDNYDSFTYNLSQAFQGLGENPKILRNDVPGLLEMASHPDLKMVCLSPGPGHPRSAGLCQKFLELLLERKTPVPVLGVCLGHQVLAEFAGAKVGLAGRIMHGRVSTIKHSDRGIFRNLPQDMVVGRYHSLLVSEPYSDLKYSFDVSARTPEGEIMAISYQKLPWFGVQFHPESVLTPEGRQLLANFLHGETQKEEKAQTQEPPRPLSAIFEVLGLGGDLDEEMASQVFERLMDGELSQAQAGALLLSLRTKGETPIEVAAAAQAVLKRASKVPETAGPTLDVVGTGGDNRFSFNCSTATALTCAAMGHRVMKHGNRSVSSSSGSADVLERLGFNIELAPSEVPAKMDRDNFVFLYAPQYHPAFRHIMPVRRELGVRTLFNILGPLVNPAKPSHRLIGVYQPELLDLMARALARLGGVTAAVVHGAGGYDELTPIGPAQVRIIKDGQINTLILDPQEFGFATCEPKDLAIKDPVEGAEVLRKVLSGFGPKPMMDMLAFNVGLALYLLKNESMDKCMSEAKLAISHGEGRKLLPPLAV
jgi:anthranilate synthase/phosphoribosyltransferase